MNQPDIKHASAYAFARLEYDLSPLLVYHTLFHTRDEVLPAIMDLAHVKDINDEDLMVLRTAACYHDIGFVEQYDDHEAASIRIVRSTLPQFGYTAAHIERISGIIQATKLPQAPQSVLEQVMADADLANLGCECFLQRSLTLRTERAAFGHWVDVPTWYRQQLQFLQNHYYFTNAGRYLYEAGKQRNIVLLRTLLTLP
jgi:uncharacterized protein